MRRLLVHEVALIGRDGREAWRLVTDDPIEARRAWRFLARDSAEAAAGGRLELRTLKPVDGTAFLDLAGVERLDLTLAARVRAARAA